MVLPSPLKQTMSIPSGIASSRHDVPAEPGRVGSRCSTTLRSRRSGAAASSRGGHSLWSNSLIAGIVLSFLIEPIMYHSNQSCRISSASGCSRYASRIDTGGVVANRECVAEV